MPRCDSAAWPSVPVFAGFRAVPVQRPGGADVIVAEEIGADRLRQGGIVEQDREVLTGLLAVALSSGSDLRAVRITGMHAIGRSVLGLAFFHRDKGTREVECQRRQLSGKARPFAGELSDL